MREHDPSEPCMTSQGPPLVFHQRGISSLGIMLLCSTSERHAFEGFCVPDFVYRLWIRMEERDQEKEDKENLNRER